MIAHGRVAKDRRHESQDRIIVVFLSSLMSCRNGSWKSIAIAVFLLPTNHTAPLVPSNRTVRRASGFLYS